MKHPAERITAFSNLLLAEGVDVFIQPMVDEFQSEYTPGYAQRLAFLSGFDGSAGIGVFWAKAGTSRKPILFTDGRYLLQAERQVGKHMQIIDSGETSVTAWLASQTTPLRVGFNPWLVTQSEYAAWQSACRNAPINWVPLSKNPADALWKSQPAYPSGAIHLHPLRYAGESYAKKQKHLLNIITQQNADALLLTAPDSINWLLNIRGSDVEFNPLVMGYFLLYRDGRGVFCSFPRTLSAEVQKEWKAARITYADIHELWGNRVALAKPHARVLMDAATAPYAIAQHAKQHQITVIPCEDPTLLPKATKNAVEVEGIRAAHVRDGHALTSFLFWLQQRAKKKHFPTECEIAEKLESFRCASPHYRGPSFATIAGAGEHGAIIHYRATPVTDRKLAAGELFLLDSGGQYPDGTTDVTRTVAIGNPSQAMREHFTRVLKGHIALAQARFPEGTNGSQLDVLARQYLWEAGLDYDHGTGHGVGAYLCVHEGPQRISKRPSKTPLVPGMILSNEPGYYRAGEYGIRIENLVLVIHAGTTDKNKPLFAFETLTLSPIDKALIVSEMLSAHEKTWLNHYHARVAKTVEAQGVSAEMQHWLQQATAPL
jgi:Xaa-Pro aminopeptidase